MDHLFMSMTEPMMADLQLFAEEIELVGKLLKTTCVRL